MIEWMCDNHYELKVKKW